MIEAACFVSLFCENLSPTPILAERPTSLFGTLDPFLDQGTCTDIETQLSVHQIVCAKLEPAVIECAMVESYVCGTMDSQTNPFSGCHNGGHFAKAFCSLPSVSFSTGRIYSSVAAWTVNLRIPGIKIL